jgi:hypothetical protein
MHRVPRALAPLVAVALALTAVGCTPTPTDTYGADGGLTVGIVQGRDDRGARIVAIELVNNRDDAIELHRAELATAQLSAPAVWERGTVLRPGLRIDLRVHLPAPACPLADDLASLVTVNLTTAAGVERVVRAVPDQPGDPMARIAEEDCVAAALDAQATVTVRAIEYSPGSRLPAVLVVGIEPRDVAGSVTIVGVGATVLIGLADPSGALSQQYAIGRVVDRNDTGQDLRIGLIPNRCDRHAILEDKRGTFIPLELETSTGLHGTYFLAMSEAQKSEAYDFITDYCGTG